LNDLRVIVYVFEERREAYIHVCFL
jgi:hypothetical protein